MLLMEMASVISYFWVTVKYVGTPYFRGDFPGGPSRKESSTMQET